MDVLHGRGHIHFYDALELIADDLGGRGSCEVSTKIRVMDDFFRESWQSNQSCAIELLCWWCRHATRLVYWLRAAVRLVY